MALFEKGNEWWRQRTKHGRDKLFSTPDILWNEACKYFESVDARKWTKKDWVGKDAIEVERENETPYTKSGLYLFLDIDNDTWDLYKKRTDFIDICSRIEKIIYTQKIEGASVGAFNPSIVARELGLAEKTDLTATVTEKTV
jgi:hypothetical protein